MGSIDEISFDYLNLDNKTYMPPKQKEAKKGPTYKATVPLKDIVPADIKEPPREPKPLKTPESFPEAPKNVNSP